MPWIKSTRNRNMALRGFIYIAKLFERYLDEHALDLHDDALIKLPTPELIVLYNGEAEMPDSSEQLLSDAFMSGTGCLECRARVLNINANRNSDLMRSCKVLSQYAELVKRLRKAAQAAPGADQVRAAARTELASCIRDGVLSEYLIEKGASVLSIFEEGYDEERVRTLLRKRAEEKGLKEGIEQGLEQGLEQGRREMLLSLCADGLISSKVASERMGTSVSEVEALIAAL